ncbi:MAG: ShlB/FhaC/HecB family hemolysin secretion/activation protein, partial [Pseudomonadales bacterium]
PSASIDQVTINHMLEKIRQSKPEGFTIGQLQDTANQVTQYYRQQGFILALAIIPQQKIQGGVVIVSVLPGELGQLSTANNQHYSDPLLKAPFTSLIGKPVQAKDVESALLRLNDLPGLDAFGVFRPGKAVGETELILNAKTETPFEFAIYADDHGVDTTGKKRVIGNFIWNNPVGNGDRLSITALQTFNPDESTYGAIYYESLVFNPYWSAGFTYSVNEYAIGQEFGVTEFEGETRIASVFTKYSLTRTRDYSLWGKLDFSRKIAEIDLPAFNTKLGEDDLSVVSTTVEFNSLDTTLGGGINEGSISYHLGLADFAGSMDSKGDGDSLRTGGSGEQAGGDFQKLAFDLKRLQAVTTNSMVLLRLKGQFSNDLLSSIEQYSMGGPHSVRAFPVSEYIRDKALFASAEWIFDVASDKDKSTSSTPSQERVQLSFFLDYAKGRKNDHHKNLEKKEQNISGAGVGLELSLTEDFYIKMEAATPLNTHESINGDNYQLWFSTGLKF